MTAHDRRRRARPRRDFTRPARSAIAPDDLAADRARALQLIPVSRETQARLDRFVELLLQWQKTVPLIAPSTVPRLWTRHIADSLQLLPLMPAARVWCDLGTGGGFPGFVIACALAEVPGATVHLVESNSKKAAFLREAQRLVGVPAVIHAGRAENFVDRPPQQIEVVTARALASLKVLLDLSAPLLEAGAQGLFPKGQDVELELTEASRYWSIAATLVPSKTDPHGRIVVVKHVGRRMVNPSQQPQHQPERT
jgi:16S rRNA (guanine527-N7)-methyltransferase